MSQRIVLACDICHTEEGVATVVISRAGSKSMEMDLCGEHWNALLKRYPSLRPTAKAAGRPQVKLRKTELPPQP